MVYRVISIVCATDHTGFEIGFVEVVQEGGKWSIGITASAKRAFTEDIISSISSLQSMQVGKIFELHRNMGMQAGKEVNNFILENGLEYKSAMIAFKGLENNVTAGYSIGDGAAVAAITKLPVVSDMYSIDLALGGTGKSNEKLALDTGLALTDVTANALRAVLRWREEPNIFSSESGAVSDSIGGALWMGSGEFL